MTIYVSTLTEGLIISLFSVLIVFLILSIVAFSIYLLQYLIKEKQTLVKKQVQKTFELSDIKDEDMMVAALVASIDYYDEIKKDVRVISIKEITNA